MSMTTDLPDFSSVDFSFRPVIAPKPPEEIDEDDPMSRFHDVAYCSLNSSMHWDGISVDVDVSGSGYRYVIYSDDLDLDEFPDGEVAEESDVPLTLGELLVLIETPIRDEYCWYHSPFSCYWFDSLEDGAEPADAVESVEVSSEMYPELHKFYEILGARFVAMCSESGGMPDKDKWMEIVEACIDI